MRLRVKFAVVLLIATIFLSAMVYGGLEIYKDQLVDQTSGDVNETAALTADQIDATVKAEKDFIGFTASRPKMARFNQSDTHLTELVDNSRYFAAQLIAANGTIIDFSGDITGDVRQETIGSNVGDRRYVQEALSGNIYVDDPHYSESSEAYIVIVSAPIFEDREIVGVLAAAIYIDQHTVFTMVGPLETSEQAVLVSDGETTLYGGDGAFDQAITATATVPETGWTVQVSHDRTTLNTQLRDLAIMQGIGLLMVLLAVVGFAAWEYRTTLKQTEKLLRGFGALEAGNYNYSLSLAMAEEWEQISDGFNELAGSLATRERELRQRKQRLEVLNRVLRHNLRHSATVLIGYGQLVQEANDPQLAEAGEQIVETTQDLTTMGEKAREIETSMEASDEAPSPIEVIGLLAGVLDELHEAYPEVTIHASLPERAWAYTIPAIELAIENVAENACMHNPEPSPQVHVSVSPGGDDNSRLVIKIADNGPGIPAHEQRVIAEGRETALEHGSGLGLWLANWTMERSGGDLRLDTSDSEGSIVRLELPRVPTDHWPEGGMALRPIPTETGFEQTVARAEPGEEKSVRWPRLESLLNKQLLKFTGEHRFGVGASPSKVKLEAGLDSVRERFEDTMGKVEDMLVSATDRVRVAELVERLATAGTRVSLLREQLTREEGEDRFWFRYRSVMANWRAFLQHEGGELKSAVLAGPGEDESDAECADRDP